MCAALSGMFAGCVDLDIPPKNILSGEDIYNEGGITAYMSGLYSQLPMEDFNMSMMVSIMVSLIGIALFGI